MGEDKERKWRKNNNEEMVDVEQNKKKNKSLREWNKKAKKGTNERIKTNDWMRCWRKKRNHFKLLWENEGGLIFWGFVCFDTMKAQIVHLTSKELNRSVAKEWKILKEKWQE